MPGETIGNMNGLSSGDMRTRPHFGSRGILPDGRTLFSQSVSFPSTWHDITHLQCPIVPGVPPAFLDIFPSYPAYGNYGSGKGKPSHIPC